MPKAPQATAAQMRGPICSFRKIQLITATMAGIADIITPADTAPVRLTPSIMQSVNRKLPRKDSRKINLRVCGDRTGSVLGLRKQRNMAIPPLPKRNQTRRNTGRTIHRQSVLKGQKVAGQGETGGRR